MPQKYDIIMGDKFEEFHQAFKDVKKCESKKFCFKKSFKINGKETIGSKKNEFNSLNHNNKQILNNEEYIQNHPEGNSKSKYVFKRVDPVDLKNSVQPIQHKAKSSQINNTNKVTIINSSLNPSKEGYIDVQQTKAKSSQISNTNKVTIINSSLNPSKEDFMDDEEFERRFGNGETSNQLHLNCNNLEYSFNKSSEEEMKGITLNDFDLSDINWEEHFDSKEESKCNKNNLQTQSSVLNQFNRRKDDSEEFQGTYPHSEIVFETLNHKFGLQSFRPHQREIINASLNSHDIFVLMPTGGGKSLCYQLPAILAPGVTIVISPLRALISDQVDKLNALDIPSAHLCSDVSKSDTNTIFNKLCVREPLLKLLYLTPEKIVSSCKVLDMLKNLYERDKLARVVIDEAHCLSQWGHDFRPDYKQLSLIRRQFSKVPIICLTATATKQVQGDVVNILHLKDVKTFIRSFNRPNIKYKVIPKSGKNVINEIAALIKSKFLKKSGIIYCLCRADCDNLAKDLCRVGIKAKPYHAGMADKAREKQQREWMQDQFHVIVATIAFGMGIDKPDVRFVIHNSIPKSVEAFYQESGRGGRDGKVSYSYLFYNYNDVVRLQKLITMDRSMKKHTLDGHFESLKQMVSYAENKVDCRRYLQLVHLGEYFDKKLCLQDKDTICDNCENVTEYKNMDVSKEATELFLLVKDIATKENVTLLHIAEIYKGSKIKKIIMKGHDKHRFYGAGNKLDKNDIQRILKELLLKNILSNFCTYTGDFPVVYIRPGSQSINSNVKFTIPMCLVESKAVEIKKTSLEIVTSSTMTSTVNVTYNFELNQIFLNCHEELLAEVSKLAVQNCVTMSSIMNLSAIQSMAELLPKSEEEFFKIQHVTKANFAKYGKYFLPITLKYREQRDKIKSSQESSSMMQRESSQGSKRKSTEVNVGCKKYKRSTRKKTKPTKRKSSKKKVKTSSKNIGLMPIMHFK